MKPKTTFIAILLVMIGFFIYDSLDSKQYYKEKTNYIEPTNTPSPTETPTPKVEKGKLYYNQSGEIFSSKNIFENQVGEIKIDRISYYFYELYDGTFLLNMSLEGELLSGNADFWLRYKLYDKNNYVVDDGIFRINNLEAGDKFKNQEITVYDLYEIGDYTLKIMDYE